MTCQSWKEQWIVLWVYVLQKWVEDNEKLINSEKTNYQLFIMKNGLRKPLLTFNNLTVEEIVSKRYLGFILDQRLTFNLHVKEICEKVNSRLKMLKRFKMDCF